MSKLDLRPRRVEFPLFELVEGPKISLDSFLKRHPKCPECGSSLSELFLGKHTEETCDEAIVRRVMDR